MTTTTYRLSGFWTILLLVLMGLSSAQAQTLRGTYAAGIAHSLSIHADGTLWASGDNTYGQLGDGTTNSRGEWRQIGSATTWVQVSAGQFHSMALQTNGSLYTWGSNLYGQLGTSTNSGTLASNTAPMLVTGTYTQIAAGSGHSLALQADGSLYAWGLNIAGQLGYIRNTRSARPNPTPLQIAGTYTQIAAGSGHSLALQADGSLYAWGRNLYGQLGAYTLDASVNEIAVRQPGPYVQIAAGPNHTLALRANGSLWAWGLNNYGQLANTTNLGIPDTNPIPVQVPGTYVQASAGENHSAGLTADGSLYVWGGNQYGQLGATSTSGTLTPTPTPAQMPGTYTQAIAGGSYMLALQANGALIAWGNNEKGQLGNAANYTIPTANPIPTATGTALTTRSTAMGSNFSLAVRTDGTLWAWGNNQQGQLGDGTTTKRSYAVQIGTDRDWVQVAAGGEHSLGLKADGTVWGWGNNTYGQLGGTSPAQTLVPTLIPGSARYTQVAAGNNHSIGLRADGTVYTWGSNQYGQLGNPVVSINLNPNATPVAVVGGGIYKQVAAGQNYNLALRADGIAVAWGVNDTGQLGNLIGLGNLTANTIPALVPGLYKQVAAGSGHSLGLQPDGTILAWGTNASGQLGTGLNSPLLNSIPMLVGTDSYKQVVAGRAHSLALRADGTLWSWGNNANGQLGLGTATSAINAPAQEATLGTNWATLAVGSSSNTSLVRTALNAKFASAGLNDNGQLGDGTTTDAQRFDRLSPLASLQPLPVELISFGAERTASATVVIAWATASEKNNEGFNVEKSTDGEKFVAIGFVAGAGTAHSYTLTDASASQAAYYRLVQRDTDNGPATYSPIRYVAAGMGKTLVVVPNPARGPVQVLGLPATATLTVFDALGRCCRPAASTLDVTGLPAGVYMVQATIPGQAPQSTRLVVE